MFITMDVRFFEDKPLFENHLYGGTRRVEDDIFCIADQNFANKGTDFTYFLEESSISINQKETFQNNIPEKSDVSIQSTNEKEFETSENNDQALAKKLNIENYKCLDSLALVPYNRVQFS